MSLTIYVDAATNPNPGQMGAGVSVVDESGIEIHTICERLGEGTSNVAEYRALHVALEWCVANGHQEPRVYMDSQLCVRQTLGQYNCEKEHLIPLCRRARELVAELGATLEWIPREKNARADELSKRARLVSHHDARAPSAHRRSAPAARLLDPRNARAVA